MILSEILELTFSIRKIIKKLFGMHINLDEKNFVVGASLPTDRTDCNCAKDQSSFVFVIFIVLLSKAMLPVVILSTETLFPIIDFGYRKNILCRDKPRLEACPLVMYHGVLSNYMEILSTIWIQHLIIEE